jgi:hypothetical protein
LELLEKSCNVCGRCFHGDILAFILNIFDKWYILSGNRHNSCHRLCGTDSMGDTTPNLQDKVQTLRAQAQDLQLKTAKAQEYVDEQQARRLKLLAEREQYVTQNPSAAGLVTPSVEISADVAQEPSGCLFAGKSNAAKTPATPATNNIAAHPKLVNLNAQVADCDNLLAVWKKRVEEYRQMADKLTADADTLEKCEQTKEQTAPATNPSATTYTAVLRRTDIQSPPVNETLDQPFTTDAIHIRRSHQVISGNTIRDTILDLPYGQAQKLAELAHRDAIQLIPADQFAAGELEVLTISGNSIYSAGKLQGIFGSDGIFRNLTITNNTLATDSDHKITLNGLVGTANHIENNRDANGKLVTVQLNPIRLGGNLATGNVWILSVATKDAEQYGYSPLNVGSDGNAHLQDNRTVAQNRDRANGDVNLTHFPVSEFKQQLRSMTVAQLLTYSPSVDKAVNAWLLRVGELLPGSANLLARAEQARAAYTMQRDVPILDLMPHSPDLQNFFIQALAKWMAEVPVGQA